jgi:hypothetical protein
MPRKPATTTTQAPAVNNEMQAPTGEALTGEAMNEMQAPAPEMEAPAMEEQAPQTHEIVFIDWEKVKSSLVKVNSSLNDGKTKGAHVSKVNSLYFEKVVASITADFEEKHAFDIVNGVILFLRHEVNLSYKRKEKEGSNSSVAIDGKASLSAVEVEKRNAYDAYMAYQVSEIAKGNAYKAGLLYARPASE